MLNFGGLGRRAGARLASRPRCTGPRDDHASVARELRPTRLVARRARQPARMASYAISRRARAPSARYEWTLFKPDREALDALAAGLRERRFSLPIGFASPSKTRSPRSRMSRRASPAVRCCALTSPNGTHEHERNRRHGRRYRDRTTAAVTAEQHLRDDPRRGGGARRRAGAVVFPARAGPRAAEDLELRSAVRPHHCDRQLLPQPGHRQARCDRLRAAESARDAPHDLGRRGRRHRFRHQSAAGAGRDRRVAQGRRGEGAGDARALPRRGPVVEAAADARRRAEPAASGAGRPAHHVPDGERRTAGCFAAARGEETVRRGRRSASGRLAVHDFAEGSVASPRTV